MVHATIPKSSNSSCNVIASHTRQAAQITQDPIGVAKKLMDKAGKEGKPWNSGLFDYRVTPQSGSIASPLQLMTQCTPREKNLPQLPRTLGTPEMHQTPQELIKRQGNKLERKYQELVPGTPVWLQHRQNATWEPAYSGKPVCTKLLLDNARKWCIATKSVQVHQNMVKTRSTPTEGEQQAQI